ncbi:MAG: HNH endonuclease domain-containing protein [Deinococcota bacterium]
MSKLIQSILRHDKKLNTFKIALIRALNDTALNFAALSGNGHGVAVPLRVLAECWIGYYWPFMDTKRPIMQGPRVFREGVLRQDVAFRKLLTELKELWRSSLFGSSRPSDGVVLVSEMRVKAHAAEYGPEIQRKYNQTIRVVMRCVEQPITYAGVAGEQYTVFSRQKRLRDLPESVVPLPGTGPEELCVVVPDAMWEGFKFYSLFIDALCIHEWSVFTESVSQEFGSVSRGTVYQALTDRPDNRRPLTWERNRIDLLLMEGERLNCFWTGKLLSLGNYDVDHIIPVTTYPINDLWNLVPAESSFNRHIKRAMMPADEWRGILPARLIETYSFYERSPSLKDALSRSSCLRFTRAQTATLSRLAEAVTTMVFSVAESKNTPRFKRPS